MTFEQFQQTRKHVDDVNETIGVAADEPCSGFVYKDDLHIFAMNEGAVPPEYLLVIANCQWVSADLDDLERKLYDFGVSEGMIV